MKVTSDTKKNWQFAYHMNKLKYVKRAVSGEPGRAENAAEHSWSVALMCWLLARSLEREFKRKIDTTKLLKMSLMHDLVEIEVGDASIFDAKDRAAKEKKEPAAARKLFAKLDPKLQKEFTKLWEEFEALKTLEAKIVRGMDKLSGMTQRMETGEGWNGLGSHGTATKLDSLLLDKLTFSTTLLSYYEEQKKIAIKKKMLLP